MTSHVGQQYLRSLNAVKHVMNSVLHKTWIAQAAGYVCLSNDSGNNIRDPILIAEYTSIDCQLQSLARLFQYLYLDP